MIPVEERPPRAPDGVLNTMDLGPFARQLSDPGLCTDCGECCHFGVDLGGEAIATLHDLPCMHLRPDAGEGCSCRVYHRRLDPDGPAPWCRSVYDCVREGLLPTSCPYVANIPDYRGRISFKRSDERKLLEPLLAGPKPQGIDDLAWERARGRPPRCETARQITALLDGELPLAPDRPALEATVRRDA
jgi:hypothetical protein